MKKAVGLIETIGLAVAIEAADAAVKAANVTLLGYENTRGSGKITVKIAGDVSAVKAGVAAAVAAASRVGEAYGHTVMPRPHDEVATLIRNIDRGPATPAPASEAPSTTAEESPVAEEEASDTPETAESEGDVTPAPEASETESAEAEAPASPERCIAITKSGERCKLPALKDAEYCFVHRELEETNE